MEPFFRLFHSQVNQYCMNIPTIPIKRKIIIIENSEHRLTNSLYAISSRGGDLPGINVEMLSCDAEFVNNFE